MEGSLYVATVDPYDLVSASLPPHSVSCFFIKPQTCRGLTVEVLESNINVVGILLP